MARFIQPSFAKGEISPSLHGRVDIAAYQVALAKASNMVVHTYGGISNRPGLQFIGAAKDHTYAPRLIPFEFRTDDAYVLEFGDEYMRVIREDQYVLEGNYLITDVTIEPPDEGVQKVNVTVPGHPFAEGDTITIGGVVGTTEANGRWVVIEITDEVAGTFRLGTAPTVYVDATGWGTYISGGNASPFGNVITNITQAAPAVVTVLGHGLTAGDTVFLTDVGGMTQLNNRFFRVGTVTTDTYQLLSSITGENIDSSVYGAYTSGGAATNIFQLVTPYTADDLDLIKFAQSADVMTLVHPDYEVRELSRFDHNRWTLTLPQFHPSINYGTFVSITVDGANNGATWQYQVTATSAITGEESLPFLSSTLNVHGSDPITGLDPVRIKTTSAHNLSTGDVIEILDNSGEVNSSNQSLGKYHGQRFRVTVIDADEFTIPIADENLADISSTTCKIGYTFVRTVTGTTAADNTITWTAPAGETVDKYTIYRRHNGVWAFAGQSDGLTFKDANITPDVSVSPPIYNRPFAAPNDFPGTVGFFEQRRVFGATHDRPDTCFYSQTGNFSNFTRSSPSRLADAMTVTLSSTQVNQIRHFVALNDLIILTSGAEWRVNSGSDTGFGVETIRQKPQTAWGCSHIAPVVVGSTILFVQANDAAVRSLGYSLQSDGYTGSRLDLLATHMLGDGGFTINKWAYSNSPDSRIFMVRDDGTLLCLAFDQEQEVVAWTTWNTDGQFEDVTTLQPDADTFEKFPYFVVRRVIDGHTVRFIERAHTRFFDDVRDCFFLDSGLSLDLPLTITGATAANPVVITSVNHGLSDGDEVDIFDIVWQPDVDETGGAVQPDQLNTYRYLVANSTANTFSLQDLDGNNIDGTAFNAYVQGGTARKVVSSVTGIEHLASKDVVILADGNVITDKAIAADGSVDLGISASRVHIGLPYVSDLETLNLEPQGNSIQGRTKHIANVIVRFDKSRGLWIGPNFDELVESKWRDTEDYDDPIALASGDKEIVIAANWNSQGRVCIRQNLPLPLSLLAIIPRLDVGDD